MNKIGFIFVFLGLVLTNLSAQEILYYRFIEPREDFSFSLISPVEAEASKNEFVYEVSKDKSSRPVKIRYLRKGNPFPDEEFGANQVRFTYGREKDTISFENVAGLAINNPRGISSIHLFKDSSGNYTRSYYYNAAGELTLNEEGVASKLFAWDSSKSPKKFKTIFFNVEGASIANKEGVFQTYTDWEPSRTIIRYLDADGRPMVSRSGVAGLERLYYPEGKLFLKKTFGLLGEPRPNPFGILSTVYFYNGEQKLIRQSHFDIKGAPIEDEYGVATYKLEYDLDLDIKRTFHYDRRDELTLNDKGVAMYKELIYHQTNEREVSHYGLEYNPNYFKLKPNQVKYDEKQKLINDFFGIGVTRYVYDVNGNLLEKRIFDKDKQITQDDQGVFLYRQTFNDQGLLESRQNFNDFNRPVEDIKGIARYEYFYDVKGNLMEQKQFGLDHKLKEDPIGVAIYQWTYNSLGLPIRQRNLGEFAQLKEDISGVAVYEWVYNRAGKKMEQTNYGSDNRTLEDKAGAAVYKWLYDERDNLVQYQRFDKNGNLLGS